ncbi:hypothetical protein BBM20_17660 [Vibrio parahaemolyticus]|uniref:hypothetical protein n=1 Tax=Vibrio parahaemolyticus TaxID=670 RepID=UPI00084AAC74|nr:hypothetical protein [Vibrio parahaemolyticus]EJC7018485.1 hypothetical protein [Vibrio parahaemolyticus]ODY26275.1 hypothetical protein BBM20_17660 [Vibrio parahaemolyticus]WMO01753.1 hypothetical protein NI379_06695 [Vibrio parahaemolyticus]
MDIIAKSGSSLASSLVKSFTTNVIERWTRHRAECFFQEFQNYLQQNRITGDVSQDIAQEIEELLSTEHGSEVIFDSYRRVSIARSKNIGPRIIGVLTAELCLEERVADESEELIFSVAETLNDAELTDVSYTINNWIQSAENDDSQRKRSRYSYIESEEVKYIVDRDVIEDISYVSNSKIDLSVDNLYEDFGSGIQKLKNLGVLSSRVQQSTFSYTEDSERYIDQDGTAQVTVKLIAFPLRYRRLLTLIEQMSLQAEL